MLDDPVLWCLLTDGGYVVFSRVHGQACFSSHTPGGLDNDYITSDLVNPDSPIDKNEKTTQWNFRQQLRPLDQTSMKAHHLALRVALAYYCDSPYKYKVCMSPPTPPPPLSPCISTELPLLLRAAAAAVAEGKLV